MTIKPKVLNGWKILKEHSDIEKIHQQSIEDEAPVSRTTIGSALRTGKMNEQTFEAINKFYNKKKEIQDALMKSSKTLVEDDGN